MDFTPPGLLDIVKQVKRKDGRPIYRLVRDEQGNDQLQFIYYEDDDEETQRPNVNVRHTIDFIDEVEYELLQSENEAVEPATRQTSSVCLSSSEDIESSHTQPPQ